MADWEDDRIRTGIDKLMKYLEREKEVNVSEAADSLDVDRDTVLTWAKSLQQSGLAEIKYTARRGRILRIAGGPDDTEETVEEAKDRVSQHIQKLSSLAEEQARLERFENVMKRMESRLEDDEHTADSLLEEYEKMGADLEELEEYLNDVRAVETDIGELESHIDELKQDLKVLSAVGRNRIEALHDGEEVEIPQQSNSILSRITNSIPFLGRSGEQDERETFKCEQCGKTFDTRRGIKTHHGMVHRKEEQDNDTEEDDG